MAHEDRDCRGMPLIVGYVGSGENWWPVGKRQHAVRLTRERQGRRAGCAKERIRAASAFCRPFRQSKKKLERIIFPGVSYLHVNARHEKAGAFKLCDELIEGKLGNSKIPGAFLRRCDGASHSHTEDKHDQQAAQPFACRGYGGEGKALHDIVLSRKGERESGNMNMKTGKPFSGDMFGTVCRGNGFLSLDVYRNPTFGAKSSRRIHASPDNGAG